MDALRGFVAALSDGLAKATRAALGALGITLIAIVGYAVVLRYVFKSPPTWSQEWSTLLFVWICFLGASTALKLKGHVTFDFFIEIFPARIYSGFVLVKDVLSLAILLIGFVLGSLVAGGTFPQFFQTIPVSLGFLYTALPLNFLVMAVHALNFLSEDWNLVAVRKGVIEKPHFAG